MKVGWRVGKSFERRGFAGANDRCSSKGATTILYTTSRAGGGIQGNNIHSPLSWWCVGGRRVCARAIFPQGERQQQQHQQQCVYIIYNLFPVSRFYHLPYTSPDIARPIDPSTMDDERGAVGIRSEPGKRGKNGRVPTRHVYNKT